MNFVKKGIFKNGKIYKKKEKRATQRKKTETEQSKAVEDVANLLELHKLQGTLLVQLHKEVQRKPAEIT